MSRDDTAANPEARETAGPVFLQLNATYTIQPGASLDDLLIDFRCLFESGMGAIETEIEGFTHAQWAGCYALRQAGAVFDELERVARQLARAPAGSLREAGQDSPGPTGGANVCTHIQARRDPA